MNNYTPPEVYNASKPKKKAQEIAQIGSWELDPASDRLTCSDEVYRIFGVHPGQFGATCRVFLDLIHLDDRAMVNQANLNSLDNGDSGYKIEHRIVRSAGNRKRARIISKGGQGSVQG